ncbi:SIS domain-containing protein [Methanocaldococcus infernus]|uniref:Sugar isomerase (SIS) n=1 Tax=Methanocaldococcus infernus (strain DSM 11812 / JCM 15783 / ME) TaxID=573063 RepID=D5VS74_METIM|nr:SIS domain-containing protein [Methanocaldococcus infernus]ADG13427.1 sugar isomerase (SIS) [Methanocaldococcus infernus ME]
MELNIILNNIKNLENLDEEITFLSNKILNAKRVFIFGVGRSGYIGRCFHIRLLHLNIDSYFLTDAPAFKRGDLLIVISGSGETESVVNVAKKAKEIGEVIGVVCKCGNLKDIKLIKLPVEKNSFLPMGTAFEELALIFFDLVIAKLMRKLNLREEDIIKNHNNLL